MISYRASLVAQMTKVSCSVHLSLYDLFHWVEYPRSPSMLLQMAKFHSFYSWVVFYCKGNWSWIFVGRTDAESPILWPPDVKNWLNGKDADSGKDWRQEEKGTTEDEMVRWHHWPDGRESEQAPGVGDGQGNLVCCSPGDHEESDTTEGLNWNHPIVYIYL